MSSHSTSGAGATTTGTSSYCRLRSSPREGAETQLPYHVEMKGRAFFHFDDLDLSDVEKSRMIKLNGASILFGLLRAEVAHVTALGRYGPMLLPAVNLMEAFRARSQDRGELRAGS